MNAESAAPAGTSTTQSVAVGAVTPAHVATTVPPSDTDAGLPVTVHVKLAVVVSVPSETLAVTAKAPAAVGVPVTRPVEEFTPRPPGNPVALYVNVSASGSLPCNCSDTTLFVRLVCGPGFASSG